MKVILTEKINKLGEVGEVVKVKEGYARNYLFPKKLALPETKENLKRAEALRKDAIKSLEMSRIKAKEISEEMAGMVMTVKRKAGEDGKIFGSVSETDIVNYLSENEITVEKKAVILSEKIKTLGNYEVKVKLFEDIAGQLKIIVEKEEE
jgi:large subunit ribosomal protein L9